MVGDQTARRLAEGNQGRSALGGSVVRLHATEFSGADHQLGEESCFQSVDVMLVNCVLGKSSNVCESQIFLL